MAGDTETKNGDVFLLQIYTDSPRLYWVSPDNVLKVFLNTVFDYGQSGHTNAIFFHNLRYDLPILFMRYADKFALSYSKFIIDKDLKEVTKQRYDKSINDYRLLSSDTSITLFTGKQFFAFVKRGKKRIMILDSFSFLPNSLKRLALKLKLQHKKKTPPKGLGKRIFKPEDKAFIRYALNDVIVEYELAQFIIEFHKLFNVRICVSSPQLFARIFKHRFIRKGDIIQFPDNPKIIDMAIKSYHGGRNGLFIPEGWVKGRILKYDYVSAYPFAMKNIPNFLSGEWVLTNHFITEYEGVYQISGYAEKCPYPVIIKNDNRIEFYNGEAFTDVCITSYELREAIRLNEVKITAIKGYIWKPDKADYNPFADYVDYFFKKKSETPKDNPLYEFFKVGLNSLYGKTIQAISKDREADIHLTIINGKVVKKSKEYEAGGLYNPPIASLITGYVRAMLHRDIHNYQALDCSTDSFSTFSDKVKIGAGLGDLKLEYELDKMLYVRAKFYIGFKGRKILCYATHGYQGSPQQFLSQLKNHTSRYKVKRIVQIKEALKQQKKPLSNETKPLRVLSPLFRRGNQKG
jgi:signal peptidase I